MSEPGDRLFDEEEIARILQRTAELQGQTRHPPSAGLTLRELKTLATESGLDPALVVTAVAEMQNQRAGEQSTWWGGPVQHSVDLVLPGPVTDYGWERMLDAVRTVMGQIGRAEVRGSMREWIVDKKDEGTGRFSVREEPDGSSHVHIHWNSPLPAILAYIFNGVAALIALPLVFEEFALGLFPGVPVWLALVGSLFLAMRWLVSRAARRDRERVHELMRVVSAIGAAESSPTAAGEQAPSADTTVARAELPDLLPEPEGPDTRSEESSGRESVRQRP